MTTTIQPTDLASRLLALPSRLEQAERAALAAAQALASAKEALIDQETYFLLGGHIDGKNQAERDAKLRDLTSPERLEVWEAQERAAEAALRLRIIQEESRALRSVARLVGREEEE